jgi:hypothetical protein
MRVAGTEELAADRGTVVPAPDPSTAVRDGVALTWRSPCSSNTRYLSAGHSHIPGAASARSTASTYPTFLRFAFALTRPTCTRRLALHTQVHRELQEMDRLIERRTARLRKTLVYPGRPGFGKVGRGMCSEQRESIGDPGLIAQEPAGRHHGPSPDSDMAGKTDHFPSLGLAGNCPCNG